MADAHGAPGLPPTWTSSAKDIVTTALGPSRVWATLGYGILNEVYWPTTGEPQVRDLGFIVAGEDFWAEVKRVRGYRLSCPKSWLPLPSVVHEGQRYRLTLEFLPDPVRDVLLVSFRLEGEGLRLYPLLAPHLGVSGWSNTAWVDRGLCARHDGRALCLLSDPPFTRMSAGYVGYSDGWQDFARNGRMTQSFDRAEDGNVALVGELARGEGVLALGFAESSEGARTLAASSLAEGYGRVRDHFVAGWEEWGELLELPTPTADIAHEAYLSAAMLRAHEDRNYPGAIVASLSIPWGNTRNDPGGYHLVWTRDAVEAAFGLLAAGELDDARRVLAYLAATQAEDGGWCQNFFADGRPFWKGVQLDQVGFPVLLAAKLAEMGAAETPGAGDMVRRAAGYVARNGPLSPQDRWEEICGASPFTLAVEIAALVAAADRLDVPERDYVLGLADCWNERVEEWTYVSDTPACRRVGVAGCYVRISCLPEHAVLCGRVDVRERPAWLVEGEGLVGLEFTYLARLGLRLPDSPEMRQSAKMADALLRVETPHGPAYRRYLGDAYGEHADGRPYDGGGIGRAWPLLTGERGHLALVQGDDPSPYLEAMARMTGACGLIPEQVWESEPIAERRLYPGEPTGAAMPLVWAHAEFLKLVVARDRGRAIELLDSVRARYHGVRPTAPVWYWRSEVPFVQLPEGKALVIEDQRPFVLRYGVDGWQDVREQSSHHLGFGMQGVSLGRSELHGHSVLDFTRRYPDEQRWEGHDHRVLLAGGGSSTR